MTRPRRAAATRASKIWKSQTHPSLDPHPDPATPPPAHPPPASPPRRVRRSSHRSAKRAPRSLPHRRAEFDRIAVRHISASRAASASSRLSSALTDLPSDASDPLLEEVDLRPSFARRVLDVEPEKMELLLRALVQRLRAMDQRGEEGDHGEDVQDLRGLAEQLSADRFVSHASASVKLLVACSLAELLRISAPDPLMSSRKLEQVCSLFIDQLTWLAVENEGMEAFRFSLLEQLSTVKTFVIFAHDSAVICDLFACFYAISRPHQPSKVGEYFADILTSVLDEADEMNHDILDSLLAPLVPSLRYSPSAVKLAETVLSHAANIVQVSLCSMLNASIRQIRQQKSSTAAGKPRRRTPVKKKQEEVEVPQVAELSEHHEHIADLLVAINTAAPDILIYVIPSLEDRIRAGDEFVRLANVHLLARLFVSRQDMAESYPSLFAEFLARIRDVSPAIRAEVCKVLAALMVLHPKHREDLNELLRDRLLDRDEDVRVVAVRSVGESVNFADEELLKLMSSRLRDRKPSVRAEALKQLTEIYIGKESNSIGKTAVSSGTSESEMDNAGDEEDNRSFERGSNSTDERRAGTSPSNTQTNYPAEAGTLKLSWLPQTLIQAHIALRGAEDAASADEVERVVFKKILCSKSDDPSVVNIHLRRFAVFLAGLDDTALSHLIQLANERQRCRDSLLRIADYRLRAKRRPISGDDTTGPGPRTFSGRKNEREADSANLPATVVAEIHDLSKNLSRFFHRRPSGQDDLLSLCLAVSSAVDLRIYEKVVRAVDWKSTYSERAAAQQDAVSRIGSKTAAGIFLQNNVFSRCLPGVFTPLHLSTACEIAIEESKAPNLSSETGVGDETDGNFPAVLSGVLRYLDFVSKLVPSLVGYALESVMSLVSIPLNESDSSSDVILVGLKLISRLPAEFLDLENVSSIDGLIRPWMLTKRLFNVEQSTNLAKWSTRASIRLHYAEVEEESSFLHQLTKDICLELDLFRGNTEEILAPITALTQLAKHSPKVFKPFALESFDFARALLYGSLNEKMKSLQRQDEALSNGQRSRNQTLSRRSCPSVLGQDAFFLLDLVTDFHVGIMAELAYRAVKLLVYALSFVDSKDDELIDVFKTLLHVLLQKNGDVFDVTQSSSTSSSEDAHISDEIPLVSESVSIMCAMSRLSAGRGLLYLARHHKFFRRFSPPLLVSTILLAQDEQPHIRIAFAKIVFTQIRRKKLPFRWVVAFPLMAVDPVRKNVSLIKTMMTTLFRHRRRIFERAKLESNSRSSIQLLPEAAVPELIWVLANLPEVELDQEADFVESEKCLGLMMERLLESNEYAGVLNEFIEGLSITQDATEREDDGPGAKTERIHILGRIASTILKKKQTGKKWNLSRHPGQVSFPKDMFRVINRDAETSGVHPPSLVDVARLYDNEANRMSAKKDRPNDAVAFVKSGTPALSLSSSQYAFTKNTEEQNSHPSPIEKVMNSTKTQSGEQGESSGILPSRGVYLDPLNLDTPQGATKSFEEASGRSKKRGKKLCLNDFDDSHPDSVEPKAKSKGADSDPMDVNISQDGTRSLEKALDKSKKRGKKRRSSEFDDGVLDSIKPKAKTRCTSEVTKVGGSDDSEKDCAQRTRPVSRQNRSNKSKRLERPDGIKKVGTKTASEKPVVRRSRRLRKI